MSWNFSEIADPRFSYQSGLAFDLILLYSYYAYWKEDEFTFTNAFIQTPDALDRGWIWIFLFFNHDRSIHHYDL
jgi:hypothetical protein